MASIWSGWQRQFLNRADIIVTPPNMRLLSQWAQNSATNCNNNPIDLSQTVAGSPNCAALHGIFPQAKRYATHGNAATAFNREIHLDFAHLLLVAMNTGNPYQVKNFNDVGSVFVSWGTPQMLNAYLNTAQGSQAGGGDGGGSAALLPGWHSVRRSLNTNWRKGLNKSEREIQAALRSLSHSRKVRY